MADPGRAATTVDPVLVETLAIAVPLRIDELRQLPDSRRAEVGARWATRAADAVGHHGDMLQFRVKANRRHSAECVAERRPDCDCLTGTAQVFNAMARGLAALALNPGGVVFGGRHWCMDHPGGLTAAEPALLCSASGYPVDEVTAPGRPVVTARTGGGVL